MHSPVLTRPSLTKTDLLLERKLLGWPISLSVITVMINVFSKELNLDTKKIS
jgi:hypothetical protein